MDTAFVRGYNLVPDPPAKIIPFIEISFHESYPYIRRTRISRTDSTLRAEPVAL